MMLTKNFQMLLLYEQAEFIEREMEQMTKQIKSIIHSLNASQGGELDALDGMNPLDTVIRILNNQLTSLMWIDEKVSILHTLPHLLPPHSAVTAHRSSSNASRPPSPLICHHSLLLFSPSLKIIRKICRNSMIRW